MMSLVANKNQLNKSKQAGFTLVELLIVVTLIAISVGMTGDILMSLIRSYNKTTVINEVEQQANFVALKLEKELRNASNVTAPTAQRLSFQTATGTVYYNVSANNIYRSTTTFSTAAGDALLSTSTSGQNIGGVAVSCTGTGGACFELTGTSPQVVSISFLFQQAAGVGGTSFQGKVNVNNTIVIRNTY